MYEGKSFLAFIKMHAYWLSIGLFLLVLSASYLLQNNSEDLSFKNLPQPTDSGGGVEKIEVLYTETGFVPSRLTVNLGTIVTFKNLTEVPMWVGSDPHPEHTDHSSFDAKRDYLKDSVYEYRFDSTGTFGYHNHKKSVHRGVISVTDPNQEARVINKTSAAQASLRDELVAMLNPNDPDTIFTVIDTIQDDAELALNCHDIAHDLGHRAYELYGFSEAMTFNNPNHVNHPLIQYICAGGYMHGILEELSLHQPEFTKQPDVICSSMSEVERDSCYHGIGHVFMLANERNVQDSLLDCRLVENETNMYRCFEGIRMEQFWGNTEHVASDTLGWDVEDPLATCIEAQPDEKPTCFLYAPFGYLREHPKDYFGAVRLCTESGLSDFDSSFCLKGLGITMMSKFGGRNLESSEVYVTGLSPELRYAFYQGVLGYAQLSGVSKTELQDTCYLFENDVDLCLGVHNSMMPTFDAYERLALVAEQSNSDAVGVALNYFSLANQRDLIQMGALFSDSATFSFSDYGLYYGTNQIMEVLRSFYSEYRYLDWDLISSREIRPGVVYIDYTFFGTTVSGEEVTIPGEAYIIVNNDVIQHLEIRN